VPKFTDLTIRSLPEGVHFDERTPSFAIRIGKQRNTWFVVKQPNRTKVRIGHYPQMPLAEARRRALIALGTAFDPSNAPTFSEALEAFLAVKETQLKPRSCYQLKRTIKAHFNWSKKLDKITHGDIISAIEAIKAPSEASHAFKDIRTFFNWCVPRYIKHSPCTGLKTPHKYVPRERLLSDEEIVKIWRAADQLGPYGLQIKRLIVTGQRCGQIFQMKREWVDQEKRLITWPPAIMKSNKQHTIPYGDLFATLLYDFPVITNQGKQKKQLDELSGVTGYTLHDVRKYYSSAQRRLHTPIDVTEVLLSHLSGSRSEIQRIYDLYDRREEQKSAVDSYEKFLIQLVVR
jgi:integrase